MRHARSDTPTRHVSRVGVSAGSEESTVPPCAVITLRRDFLSNLQTSLLSLYSNIINIINNLLSHLGSGTLAPPLSPASESVSADSGSVSGRRVSRELVSTKLCPEKISGLALDSRLEPDTAEAAASSSPEVSSLRWTRGCSSPAPAASRPRPAFLGLTSAAELSVTEVAASSSQLPPPRLLLLGVLPASAGVLGVRPPSV